MKKLYTSLMLCACMNLVLAQSPIEKKLNSKKMTAKIEKIRSDWNAVGVAVAIVDRDKIIYAQGFGKTEKGGTQTVDAKTLFPIGSSTKAFTATLAGQLQEKEIIDLDDRPSRHLSSLRFFNKHMDDEITLRDMLCHRTGLSRHDMSWYFFPGEDRDELIKRIQYHEPAAKPKETWIYNNFMFMAVGKVVEETTGKSYEKMIEDDIFKPLKMMDSKVTLDEMKTTSNYARGYSGYDAEEVEKEDFYDIGAMAPAGSINSNVQDMGNWLIAWINGGQFEGEMIFSEEFYEDAIDPQMAMWGKGGRRHPDINSASYGLGWFMNSYRGHFQVEHGGNIDGFSSGVAFFPKDSLGIVVLTSQNYSPLPDIVTSTIADQLLGLEKVDWNQEYKDRRPKEEEEEEEKDLVRKEGTAPTHELKEYEGAFLHPGYGSITIMLKNDSLFAQTTGITLWLKHYHYNVFTGYEMENGKVNEEHEFSQKFNFRISDHGEIESIAATLEYGLDPLIFRRQIVAVEVATNELNQYEGEYDAQGMVCKIFLKEEQLKLTVPGQPEYDLIPLGEGKFGVKDLEGYAIQFDDEDGEIVGLQFIQPNGIFTAKRK